MSFTGSLVPIFKAQRGGSTQPPFFGGDPGDPRPGIPAGRDKPDPPNQINPIQQNPSAGQPRSSTGQFLPRVQGPPAPEIPTAREARPGALLIEGGPPRRGPDLLGTDPHRPSPIPTPIQQQTTRQRIDFPTQPTVEGIGLRIGLAARGGLVGVSIAVIITVFEAFEAERQSNAGSGPIPEIEAIIALHKLRPPVTVTQARDGI